MPPSRTRRTRNYHVRTPRTAEELDHAADAAKLIEDLKEMFGVEPERCVPTGDGLGFVRLNFEQLKTLMYDEEEPPS